jgi:hypothetical protein
MIVMKKDKTLERYHMEGAVSVLEWIGAMDAVKLEFSSKVLNDYGEY